MPDVAVVVGVAVVLWEVEVGVVVVEIVDERELVGTVTGLELVDVTAPWRIAFLIAASNRLFAKPQLRYAFVALQGGTHHKPARHPRA